VAKEVLHIAIIVTNRHLSMGATSKNTDNFVPPRTETYRWTLVIPYEVDALKERGEQRCSELTDALADIAILFDGFEQGVEDERKTRR
jgi:hypothetical protein